MRIGAAMSGGMNSSLAAVMMKKVGHDVIGITANIVAQHIVNRSQTDNASSYYPDNIIAAKRVAKQYDFPHKVINLELDFLKEIVKNNTEKHPEERFRSCMLCNRVIIDNIIKYAKNKGCQRIATGHYARINRDSGGIYSIEQGFDTESDHSYLPYYLTQELLEFVMFPLGDYHRGAILKLARDYRLSVTEIVDCKDNCFL